MLVTLSILRAAVIVVALAYVFTCAALYLLQRQFLYFPTPETSVNGAEAVSLDNNGVRLKIWKVARGQTKAVIYFGGNAESVSHNIAPLSSALAGYDIYLVNYRGYGGSDGAPSEAGIFSDALALFDSLQPKYESLAVIGRSLGSGVATYLAAERRIERMLLITPYDSIRRVAQAKFPLFPVSFLLKDKYDSAARAPAITAPVLIITAENDRVIPRRHSDRLAQRFSNAELDMLVIPGADHLSVSNSAAFWSAVETFFTAQ